MGPGGSSPPMAPCGSRLQCRPDGCRIARARGCSIRSTAGPGWTPRPGAGRPITMAAGSSSTASGPGRQGRWSRDRSMRRPSSPSSAGPSWHGWRREGVGVPTWRGWGGPRVVNNVVINTTTVVNVQNINVYRNTGAPNAVVAVNKNRFGQGSIASARVAQVDVQSLRLTHTAPQVVATSASFAPTASRGVRPPEVTLKQPVVVTRPPQSGAETAAGGARKVGPPGVPAPAPRHVLTLQPRATAPVSSRPPFGQSTVERPMVDRTQLPSPPEAPVTRRVPPPMRTPQVATPAPTTPSPPPGRPATPPLPARRPEVATPLARPLPGVSANRLSPHRLETTLPRRVERQASPPPARPHGAPENG